MPSEDMKKGAAHGSRYLYITFERLLLSYLLEILFYMNFFKTFFVRIKVSKTYVFFLKTSHDYLMRYGQRNPFFIPAPAPHHWLNVL